MAPVEVFAEPTPNPNSMKFTLDRRVAEKGQSFNSPGEAEQSPLARRLFEIRGVRSIFLLNNFISVSRDPEKAPANRRSQMGMRRLASGPSCPPPAGTSSLRNSGFFSNLLGRRSAGPPASGEGWGGRALAGRRPGGGHEAGRWRRGSGRPTYTTDRHRGSAAAGAASISASIPPGRLASAWRERSARPCAATCGAH